MITSFGMFTARGNRSVYAALGRILKSKKAKTDAVYLTKRLRAELKKIAVKNGEVYDTDVREQILYACEKVTDVATRISTSELY